MSERVLPSSRGGVAAPVRKCREATLAAQTGWSLTRNLACERPPRPLQIPAINKFAQDGDPKTLGEIFAYDFRNAHRLSWDLADGTMFASDRHEPYRRDQHRPRGPELRLDEA